MDLCVSVCMCVSVRVREHKCVLDVSSNGVSRATVLHIQAHMSQWISQPKYVAVFLWEGALFKCACL